MASYKITDKATGKVYTRPEDVRFELEGVLPKDLPQDKYDVQPIVAPTSPVVSSIVDNALGGPAPTSTAPVSPMATEAPTPSPSMGLPPTSTGPMIVPTVDTKTQTQVTQGIHIPTSIQKQMEQADVAQKTAADLMAATSVAKANAESKGLQEMAEQQQAATDLSTKREANRNASVMELQKKIDDATNEAASAKIDPKRLFGGSTWGSIGAGVAAAFGAIGSALTGTPNFALKIIDDAIDRDIMAQKEAIQNKRQKVQDLRGTLQDNLSMFRDQRMAEEATRLQMLQAARTRLDGQIAKFGGDEANAKAAAVKAEIDGKIAGKKAELYQLAHDKVSSVTEVSTGTKVMGLDPKSMVETSLKLGDDYASKTKDMNEKIMSAKDGLSLVNAAKQGNQAAIGQLVTAIARMREKGALSEGDVQRVGLSQDILSRGSDWLSKNFRGTLSPQSLKNAEDILRTAKNVNEVEKAKVAKSFVIRGAKLGVNDPLTFIPGEDLTIETPEDKSKKAQELGLKPRK